MALLPHQQSFAKDCACLMLLFLVPYAFPVPPDAVWRKVNQWVSISLLEIFLADITYTLRFTHGNYMNIP